MTTKARRIAIWVLVFLLAYVFIAAGASKLLGARVVVEEFRHFRYPDWFRLLVGGIELICGLALLVPRTSAMAAIMLCPVMIGAVATHVAFREFAFATVPLSLLLLLGTLAWVRRGHLALG